jgi:hypothetical protein
MVQINVLSRQHPHRLEHWLHQYRFVAGGPAHRLLLLHHYQHLHLVLPARRRHRKVGWVRDDLLPNDGSFVYCGF